MDALPTVGKFLFAIPMAVFGILHFMAAGDMAGMVPSFVPGGVIWVYITGIALIAAAVAIIANKQAVLATQLLGVMLLIFALSIHLVALIGGDQAAMASLLKDTALAGGAFVLSGVLDAGGSEA
ncbi:MAG: DoxX family protein [Gemmatimonadota bacterium]